MRALPVLLRLTSRRAVIVGSSAAARELASDLLAAGAAVHVVASDAGSIARGLDGAHAVERPYVRGDLAGCAFAACFEDGEVATAVADEAAHERCLLWVPGAPELGTAEPLAHHAITTAAEETE